MNYSLIDVDSNAYSILGYVTRAMRECKKTEKEIHAYLDKAMASDYNNLLQVSANMIDKLNKL